MMPGKSVFISWLAALTLIGVPSPVWAKGNWQPIVEEELKMTSEPNAPGAPAIYLYRQVDRDDGFARQEYNYARIKVLTEEGRKYADIEIPFLANETHVRNVKARTVQPDGTSREFDGKIFEKTILRTKRVNVFAKTFTMPDVHIGTIIEYSFILDLNGSYDYNSRWILSDALFTRRAIFTLKPNPSFGLRWIWPIGLPQGTVPPAKRDNEIRLETQNVPAFQVEDYMPPEDALKFRVEFIYTYSSPEKDPGKFWINQGKDWFEYFSNFVNKRKAMTEAMKQIVSSEDRPEVKLGKIYARVLLVRNLSFDPEKTEQEEKREKLREINNVEDVWTRGYGDARDINWLLVALLRAAGFDAYSVFVSPRDTYLFERSMLNPMALSTDVVLVRLQSKDYYLDPGAKFAPLGMLPWYETQVQGMVLNAEGGQWIETTSYDSTFAKTLRKADLTLDEDGTLQGKLTVTLGGLEALEMRTEERNEDDGARKATLEDLVKESIPLPADVELTNKPDWDAASATLVAEYRLKVPGWVSNAGRRGLFPVSLFGSSEKHIFEHADRVHPLYFHHAYLKSDDVTVTLPSGWEVSSVPAPINHDAKGVAYTQRAEGTGSSLHLSRELRNELVWVDKGKYEVFRKFFQRVRTGDEGQVVLQPRTSSAVR